MSAWSGKHIIGLTGNIATGKSVVRRMLEHLGAYGIDADSLGHRAISTGAPGYKAVVDTFGKWILAEDGQIDRSKLGRVVFPDPEALALLEAIVHPLVNQAVDLLVARSRHQVIVLEAIKLLESPLRDKCDSIWVTHAPPETQLVRLMQKRGMSEEAAWQRILRQPPQKDKLNHANVVIRNDGSFEDTWQQVVSAWGRMFPTIEERPVSAQVFPPGKLVVERARPRQAMEIADFINRVSNGRVSLKRDDIMAAFGEKAYLILNQDQQMVGLVGWQVENLIARTDDFYIDPKIPIHEALHSLTKEVEHASKELLCEISLIFLPAELRGQDTIWRELGYIQRSARELKVRAWQEAANESMPDGNIMYFKQLRKDRVLRPV